MNMWSNKLGLALSILKNQLRSSFCLENVRAGQKFEKEATYTENVSFVTVAICFKIFIAFKYLWSNIAWGTTLLIQRFIRRRMNRDSQVSNFNIVVSSVVSYLIYQDIPRLNISVNNLFLLEKVEDQ